MNLINRKMLKIRHFSNRLLANKLGRTFSSNWRSSSTKIFGAQFSQIQSANGCPKIQQQICQRHPFCSTMADGSSIPPHSDQQQSANSSQSLISSAKMATDGNGEQRTFKLLEIRQLYLDQFQTKNLKVYLKKRAENGQKFFQIKLFLNDDKFTTFPHVPVPQDAYDFIRAMDKLIGSLAEENFDIQNLIVKKKSIAAQFSADSGNKSTSGMQIRVVEFTGLYHKFQLELVHFPEEKEQKMNWRKRRICFQIRSIKLPIENQQNKKWNWALFPLHALPWLRMEMAKMLAKHDGTEPIGEAAEIPRKLLNPDYAIRNASQKINFDGKSNHRRQMRPQLENKIPPKMPTTFSSQQKYSKMEPKIQSTNFDQFGNKKQPEKRAAQFDPQIAEVEQSLRDAILDTKQLRNKRAPRKIEDPLNPTMADLEESLRILFDFEDEEEDSSRGKKYGREAVNNGRGKFPRYEF